MWCVTESTTLTGNWATFTSSVVSHNILALSLSSECLYCGYLIFYTMFLTQAIIKCPLYFCFWFWEWAAGIVSSAVIIINTYSFFSSFYQITRWSVASISQKRTPSCDLLSSVALAWPAVSSWAQSHWTLWVCLSHEKGWGLRQSLPLPASRDTR